MTCSNVLALWLAANDLYPGTTGPIGFGRWSCSRAVAGDFSPSCVTGDVMLGHVLFKEQPAPRRPRHRRVRACRTNRHVACPSTAHDEPGIVGPISPSAPRERLLMSVALSHAECAVLIGRLSW